MDKAYVMTFIEVKNGSLKTVETEVAENITTLTAKMKTEYNTLYDFCSLQKSAKIAVDVCATNIEMYVNTPENFAHYSWNISTNSVIK